MSTLPEVQFCSPVRKVTDSDELDESKIQMKITASLNCSRAEGISCKGYKYFMVIWFSPVINAWPETPFFGPLLEGSAWNFKTVGMTIIGFCKFIQGSPRTIGGPMVTVKSRGLSHGASWWGPIGGLSMALSCQWMLELKYRELQSGHSVPVVPECHICTWIV